MLLERRSLRLGQHSKTRQRHFRDYLQTGHATDLSETTKVDPKRTPRIPKAGFDQAAPRFQAASRAETSARAVSSASLRCSGPLPTPSARTNAASLMPMNPKKLVRNVF